MTFSVQKTSSIAVLLLSSLAILGWWTDHQQLARALPAIANMTFNTALSFVVFSLLFLLPKQDRRNIKLIRLILASAFAFLALLSLLQDLFSLSFGVDALFYDAQGLPSSGDFPGRMSPLTACGFLLCFSIFMLMRMPHQSTTQKLWAHGLILCLLLLSLTGIGMSLLMYDVPRSYLHFSSISLCTAIAFLLLSIAFLFDFKQHSRITQNILLYSGIQLMYDLKYRHKFLLISSIFLIPLGVLVWSALDEQQHQIDQAKLKLLGITHIQETDKLAKAIPEHRGMSYAHYRNSKVFANRLKQKADEIDRLFAENAVMDHLHASVIAVPDAWPGLLQRWQTIKEHPNQALESWRLHTEMVALLNRHIHDIGEQALLAYDADPIVHNLLELQLKSFPIMFEQLGQLRGQGASFLARRELGHSEQVLLASMSSSFMMLLTDSKALLWDQQSQALQRILLAYVDYEQASKAFLELTEQKLIRGAVFDVSSEDYFFLATQAIQKGFAVNKHVLTYVQQLLQERVERSIQKQYNIKFIGMIVLLLLFFLFASFYRSVMNTIAGLDAVAETLHDGSLALLDDLSRKDEMGAVVRSFSTIAHALLHSNAKMSALVDHAADGMVTSDAQGLIKGFNPAAERLFGYTAAELMGKHIHLLMPDMRASFTATDTAMQLDQALDVLCVHKKGDRFHAERTSRAIVLSETQLFMHTIHDTRKHQSLEQQLRQAQKMEAMGVLLGGVAHNFNNLLAGITGKTFLLKRKLERQPQVLADLECIEAYSFQAAEMIKQLLAFARQDTAQHRQDFAFDVLLKDACGLARLSLKADVRFQVEVKHSKLMVHGDSNQLQQVILNLVNNARDALVDQQDKQLLLCLQRCHPDTAFFARHENLSQGDYACLSVQDNGCGMSADVQDQVFTPFFTTKGEGKGTGLGLSSAFSTVVAHHGVIEVESEPGSGTCFKVYIPLLDSDTKLACDDHDVELVFSKHAECILLVDDEPMVLQTMQEALEALGYRVVCARHGQHGLQCFQQQPIDAVITDLVMPEMDGLTMFRQLRTLQADLPVMFMSAYDHDKGALDASERKHTCLLHKPVLIEHLAQQLAELLASKSA